jgi:hypothetical protein
MLGSLWKNFIKFGDIVTREGVGCGIEAPSDVGWAHFEAEVSPEKEKASQQV